MSPARKRCARWAADLGLLWPPTMISTPGTDGCATAINRALGFEYMESTAELAGDIPDWNGNAVECSGHSARPRRVFRLEGTLGTYLIYVTDGDISGCQVMARHNQLGRVIRGVPVVGGEDPALTTSDHVPSSSEDRPTIHYGLDNYIAVDPQALDRGSNTSMSSTPGGRVERIASRSSRGLWSEQGSRRR